MKYSFFFLCVFLLIGCSEDNSDAGRLSGLDFPRDCVENEVGDSFISDDWPFDSLGFGFRFYAPTTYLLTPDAEGQFVFALTAKAIDTIQSWTITDEDDIEVFRLENFPANNLDFGWDGTSDSQLLEGAFLSRVTFMSPTGIENFMEWAFCGVLCEGLDGHVDNGLDLTNSRWWNQSTCGPYSPELTLPVDCM